MNRWVQFQKNSLIQKKNELGKTKNAHQKE